MDEGKENKLGAFLLFGLVFIVSIGFTAIILGEIGVMPTRTLITTVKGMVLVISISAVIASIVGISTYMVIRR